MIAMQYQIILPGDYPMEKIETRIRENGHLLDDYPGLLFKAYLYAEKNYAEKNSAEKSAVEYQSEINSYAPFYLWKDVTAMTGFLQSEGFQALCGQFGRPIVRTWLPTQTPVIPEKQIYAWVDTDVPAEMAFAEEAQVTGFDCRNWTGLCVRWLMEPLPLRKARGQYYRIGYIARGK
jgi:hypothetical protein